MKYEVLITASAEADLEQAYCWLLKRAPEAALKWYNGEIVTTLANRAGAEVAGRIGNELLDRALALGPNPFVGQPVKRRPGTRKVLRYSSLIFYVVDEARQTSPQPDN